MRQKATRHLSAARKNLPRLFFDAMQESAIMSEIDGTLLDNDDTEDEKVGEFRKYNRQFVYWCRILGMDDEEVWREYTGT